MSRIKELEQLIQDKQKELDPLKKELAILLQNQRELTKAKIIRCHSLQDKFLPEELFYSRVARCECGAGLAYPKHSPLLEGAWHCGAILTGTAEPVVHIREYSFMMYSIAGENETQTTRPQS